MLTEWGDSFTESGISLPVTFGRKWQVNFTIQYLYNHAIGKELVFIFYATNEPRTRFTQIHGGFAVVFDFLNNRLIIRKPNPSIQAANVESYSS